MKIQRLSTCLKLDMHIGGMLIAIIADEKVLLSDTDILMAPHNHKYYELRLFQAGDALARAGDMEFRVRDGDVFITPPLMYHTYFRRSDAPFQFRSIRFDIAAAKDEPSGQQQAAIMSRFAYPVLFHDDDGWLEVLFLRIERVFYQRAPGYMSQVGALLTSLMLTVLEKMFPDGSLRWSDECTAYDIQREVVIEQYLVRHYHENITVGDLAEELSLCPRQVNRIFLDLFGCSFGRKLLEFRLEQAKLFLLYTNHSVQEISMYCGFNSTSYFHTSFQKAAGCTPRQYRTSRKADSGIVMPRALRAWN